MPSEDDLKFMRIALDEAKAAAAAGEVPIGAVAVRDGVVIASGRNRVEEKHSVTAHAEFEVIRRIEALSRDWRMSDYTLYVTKEPCPMCAGMLVNARIGRVVFGVPDPVFGGCGGAFDLPQAPRSLWHFPCEGGVLANEAKELLQTFFQQARRSGKSRRNLSDAEDEQNPPDGPSAREKATTRS